MKQLVDLYTHLLTNGQRKENRTGVDTFGVFGYQMRFHLQGGFPLATRKATPFKLIASELLWFLKGKQDEPGAINDLHADKNHIWDEWVKSDGSFGRIYGVQWRHWNSPLGADVTHDQIAELLLVLKNNPESRRMVVSAWNPSDLFDMALAPCHVLFQLNCRPPTENYKSLLEKAGRPNVKWIVDLQMYQRSCDAFLGVPFNIASYALLLHMLVQCAGPEYVVGDFIWTGGDVHLYENHLAQAKEYLHRDEHHPPVLWLNPDVRDIDAFTMDDMKVIGYKHSGVLSGEVAV